MPKKTRVRTLTCSQQGSKSLLQSARQNFCDIFWWLLKKISLKNSVIVVSEILRHFVNISLHFGNLHKILNTLEKRWASEVICFWNYTLEKAGLLKCLKSALSEHLRTVNMLINAKNCLNQHGRSFVTVFDDFKTKSTRKVLS